MSDLQRRSEALLRQRGYLTASVERRKVFPAKGKQQCKACGQTPLISIASDLFNVFDMIALRPHKSGESEGGHIVLVQVTSSANHAARRNKILVSSEAKLCLLSGCDVLIQSWRKKGNRWVALDEWIDLNQFGPQQLDTVEQFYEDQARLKLLDRKSKLPALPPGSTLHFPLSPYLDDESIPF